MNDNILFHNKKHNFNLTEAAATCFSFINKLYNDKLIWNQTLSIFLSFNWKSQQYCVQLLQHDFYN